MTIHRVLGRVVTSDQSEPSKCLVTCGYCSVLKASAVVASGHSQYNTGGVSVVVTEWCYSLDTGMNATAGS